ncbi:MAG: FGGY-family carbohydrate kinase [Fimbriimonadaceae bacterium]
MLGPTRGAGDAPAAVAVDLGASSARFAEGRLVDGRIEFQVVEQAAHEPSEHRGILFWDTDALLGICRRAEAYAASLGPETTLGIDSWGVDIGFVGPDGQPVQPPVCYRDTSHARVFERLRSRQDDLYAWTGIQHQPFNTVYQLVARAEDSPAVREPGVRWLILPEFLHHLLGCPAGHELTHASTTQLMGLDGRWSPEAFALAGWPVPDSEPEMPGTIVGRTSAGVPVARIGAHDTASAVFGMGLLGVDQAFLNVGTWSLLGCLVDRPIVGDLAKGRNFTNERAVDGRVRFLENIPGFYVIGRLHAELGVEKPIPEWLEEADLEFVSRINLLEERFFNPKSMIDAVLRGLPEKPASDSQWAGLALLSLVDTVAAELVALEDAVGRRFASIRAAGGGSASAAFCRQLAIRSGRPVVVGPKEATLLGNLAVQFFAQGRLASLEEAGRAVQNSLALATYRPEES